ncbi:hypothetical protein CFIO01_12579 [Colletotrichum fioriniae PJ7]|uniref:2EXR domain-containing protein n=1 Tax=Colletotrichum fioriniae PJ7 TaxID=1445577 RepID=A0A010QS39_9PEZI|nr:hypothetical protein CFIO01_12579 [Colletotrichum fioriniae PJ7]
MNSFGKFPDLPIELRQTIWKLRLPDEDEPEVCVVTDQSRDLVYTAFSILMHVCQDSRHFVQNSKASGIEFRFSEEARCYVPVRKFRPELDIVYCHDEATLNLLRHGDNMPVGQIRHLTIPSCRRLLSSIAPAILCDPNFRLLRIVSILISQPEKEQWAVAYGTYGIPLPRGRCKLQEVPTGDQYLSSTRVFTMTGVEATYLESLIDFMEHRWWDFNEDAQSCIADAADAGKAIDMKACGEAWDEESSRLQGLDVTPLQFLKYDSGRWSKT